MSIWTSNPKDSSLSKAKTYLPREALMLKSSLSGFRREEGTRRSGEGQLVDFLQRQAREQYEGQKKEGRGTLGSLI